MSIASNQHRLGASAKPLTSLRAKSSPVVTVWAVMGALWLIFSVYVWGSWIMSPEFGPTPKGDDPVPLWVVLWTHTFEFLSTAMWAACIYFWAYKPWRQTGKMTWDGLFILAGATNYIQDPWINYSSYWFLYSSEFINFGSWVTHLPGWTVPQGNLIPEAPLAWGGAYTWLTIAPAIFAGKVINRILEKRPETSTFTLIVGFFVFFAFLDLLLEGTFAFTRLYTFASTIPSMTIFAGEYYQFPLYEMVWMGCMWTSYTFLRYLRDDKGYSVCERGVDKLNLSSRSKTFLRWLALVGMTQAILFFTYNLPIQWFAMHGGAFPQDVPSWMTNGVCGPETAFDCPSETTPIPRFNSPSNRIVAD